MKTKLTGLLIVISIAISSCLTEPQQENNDMLTSTIWKDPQANDESSKLPEAHYTFHKNGDYSLEFSDVLKITGQWKWITKNEILLTQQSIIANGVRNDFAKKQNYNVRILEISESSLKTLEKFETDAWDSGFAKEKSYKAI